MESVPVVFNPEIKKSGSGRTVWGIASAPIYDRENELITADAMKKALEAFKNFPIVTVEHRDFPIGWVTKADVTDDGKTQIELEIAKGTDGDIVLDLIKAGQLNSFSITGVREKTNCNLRKSKSEPCETHGIRLRSITLCGDNRCNPDAVITGFDIRKALFEDEMTEINIEEVVQKSVDAAMLAFMKESERKKEIDEEKGQGKKDAEEADKKEAESKKDEDKAKALEKAIADTTEAIKAIEARLTKLEDTPLQKSVTIISNEKPGAVPPIDPVAKQIAALQVRGGF